jgi:hypothetical protein
VTIPTRNAYGWSASGTRSGNELERADRTAAHDSVGRHRHADDSATAVSTLTRVGSVSWPDPEHSFTALGDAAGAVSQRCRDDAGRAAQLGTQGC